MALLTACALPWPPWMCGGAKSWPRLQFEAEVSMAGGALWLMAQRPLRILFLTQVHRRENSQANHFVLGFMLKVEMLVIKRKAFT